MKAAMEYYLRPYSDPVSGECGSQQHPVPASGDGVLSYLQSKPNRRNKLQTWSYLTLTQ